MIVLEQPGPDLISVTTVKDGKIVSTNQKNYTNNGRPAKPADFRTQVLQFLATTFLPSGYPKSVTPDYVRYQILNALQAFCNSLAGLLASRAVLESFGIGDATASANRALMLTIFQDLCGRATTIVAASALGSSLYPEARFYRFLADVLNDAALFLDLATPFLNSLPIPGLRVAALCLSAAFRSLCGLAAGGSKAAITLHFATPVHEKGDIGDLNAKDASKETILALFGMLLGMIVVPRLTAPWAIWTVLIILVSAHLYTNYLGARCLQLRTVNRQRASLLWIAFRNKVVLTPETILSYERTFEQGGLVRVPPGLVSSSDELRARSRTLGRCFIGLPLSGIVTQPHSEQYVKIFASERYFLFLRLSDTSFPMVYISLKQGYKSRDQLKAWAHAVEALVQLHKRNSDGAKSGTEKRDSDTDLLIASHQTLSRVFDDFWKKMGDKGWIVDDCALLVGLPQSLLVDILLDPSVDGGS